MTVDTSINYTVFDDGEFPVDENLLENITELERRQARAMMSSGSFMDGLYIWRFLNTDLTINLEKLEFAVSLAVRILEANSETDVTLKLRGLDDYYKLRGIEGLEKHEREERTFLLGFISAVASEASRRDTLEIKYVK